jgi:energy-coupling factor transporter ATP-binding protein EcfA2
MERLTEYKNFLNKYEYKHCIENKRSLTYTNILKLGDLRISITGLNTSWSSSVDKEKGDIFLGLPQLTEAIIKSKDVDINIVLAHHPYNWYPEDEENNVKRMLDNNFDFFLHGHEHQEWIDRLNNCIKISTGCCYEKPEKIPGYNITKVTIRDCKANVYLRTFDENGGGWIPKLLYKKTSLEGIWCLEQLPFALKKMSKKDKKESIGRKVPVRSRKRIDIFKYFTVAKAQDEEKYFVGRKNELSKGIGALMSKGTSIAIYGKAGIGKSSLALQLGYIAIGNHQELVKDYEIPKYGFHFPVTYYVCKKDIDTDFSNVLLSVLLDRTLPFSFNDILARDKIEKILDKKSNERIKKQIDLIYNEGRTERTQRLARQLFINLASMISEAYGGWPLVLILDEYDVVADKSGLASSLKAYPFIKFILSGTADSTLMLIQEHLSIPRQIAEGQIRLNTMDEQECQKILKLESSRSNKLFTFDDKSATELAKLSRGMPFFVHFYGRYSIDAALKRVGNSFKRPLTVTIDDVNSAIGNRTKDLITLEVKYLGIIEDNWKKECILNLLSYVNDDEVYIPDISLIGEKMGIAKQITTKFANSLKKDAVLFQTGPRRFEFVDIRLKVFARLRKPVIDHAYKELAKFIKQEKLRRTKYWLLPTYF